jgi:acyl-CoA thioester hydrolase
MSSLPQVTTEIKVPFYDIDSMNVVWHGHYVKYLEIARCDLLDHVKYGYAAMRDSGYAWPVVKLSLRYTRPARFGQILQIVARMTEWELRLIIEYGIFDKESGTPLSSATTMQMAVDMTAGEACVGSPPILEEKLREAGYQ